MPPVMYALKSEERFGGRTTIYRRGSLKYIHRQFPYPPRCVLRTYAHTRARSRTQYPNYARIYDRMLARAARIKHSDSSRMLTSSSACSRGNQPARDAKTCCGSSERRVSARAVPSRGYRRRSAESRCRKFLARRRGAIAQDDRHSRVPKGLRRETGARARAQRPGTTVLCPRTLSSNLLTLLF